MTSSVSLYVHARRCQSLVSQLQAPFPGRVVKTRSKGAPAPPPCAPAIGGPLTRLSLALLAAAAPPPAENLEGGGGGGGNGGGGSGEGAADLGTGGAAAAKKPSGASAANCPKLEGALQGLCARGVTFPGLRQLLRARELRVQDNRSGPGERSFKLSRLPPCCLKGRLSTSHSAYW